MDDLTRLLASSAELSPGERRRALAELAGSAGLGRLYNHLAAGKQQRLALRAIIDLSTDKEKKAASRRYFMIHINELTALSRSEDAKTRKSLAQLIGKVAPNMCVSLLTDMLRAENTDFVRPSIILALGNAKDDENALNVLKSHVIPPCEQKHRLIELDALNKAISALTREERDASMAKLKKGTRLLLWCPNVRITLAELQAMGIKGKLLRGGDNTLLCDAPENFADIYKANTFSEAGIYLGRYDTLEQALTSLKSKDIRQKMSGAFNARPLYYRCEARLIDEEQVDRRALSRRVAELLPKDAFVNDPSSYAAELRFSIAKGHTDACLLPSPKNDTRFSYRAAWVSASVHPSVSAAVMYSVRDLLKPNATVLDCFCGSGTMLFERGRYPYATLTGSDISREALDAAKRNEKRARMGVTLFGKNATADFTERYEEVISNMPFGHRVSSHDGNRFLYREFLDKLPALLEKDGTAFLFTQEKRLMDTLIKGRFTLLRKLTFSAGGLYPSLYVIKPIRDD